jgi:hypothetical protein
MKEIRKYVIIVSIVGLLQLASAIWLSKSLAFWIWVTFNSIALILFAHRYLFYRAIIAKYFGLNLRYLGDKYKEPLLLRSFIGNRLLSGKSDNYFSDVKALTIYKYLKILQLLGAIFLVFATIAMTILIVRHIQQ